MYNVFLSYSTADEHAASVICDEIRNHGATVFLDQSTLVSGAEFRREIDRAIKDADAVVLLLSSNSKRSKWVESELTKALEHKKTIIPVLLDEDGKNNWVWPLIADRQVIERKSSESLSEVARRVGAGLSARMPGYDTVEARPRNAKPVEPSVKPIPPDLIPKVIPHLIPTVIPHLALGVGAVNPLIALAAGVLPDILKAVVSDKAGTVAGSVTQAVAQITQTTNPEEAREKLRADPAAVAALQVKLAEIAADHEEKRQQAQLALLREQNEQEAKRRDAQLALFRAEIEDTKSARSTFSKLALAWGAPIVSIIVTLGFFGILILLITRGMNAEDLQLTQIINITIGVLAAAFAAVISFWLGSSQGSRPQLETEQVSRIAAQAEELKSTVEAQTKKVEALEATVKMAIVTAPAAMEATAVSPHPSPDRSEQTSP
jgi:hypothetical protein